MDTMNLVNNVDCSMARSRFGTDDFNPKGHFLVEHLNKDGDVLGTYEFPNGITNEGKNTILNVMFNDLTPIANNSWFIGLIDATSYTALANTDVMNSHGGWLEFVSYTQSTRVAWGSGSSTSQNTTNSVAATFDINTTGTVKGIFVTSNSTKNGTSGKIWSTALFPADVPTSNGDQLKITYAVAA